MDVEKDEEREILRHLRRMRHSIVQQRNASDSGATLSTTFEDTPGRPMNADEEHLLEILKRKGGTSLVCQHAVVQLLDTGEHVNVDLLKKVPFEVFLDASRPILITLRKTIEHESQILGDDDDDGSGLIDHGKERIWCAFEAIVDRVKGVWDKTGAEGWALLLGDFFPSSDFLVDRYYTIVMWKLLKVIKTCHERDIRWMKLEEISDVFLGERTLEHLARGRENPWDHEINRPSVQNDFRRRYALKILKAIVEYTPEPSQTLMAHILSALAQSISREVKWFNHSTGSRKLSFDSLDRTYVGRYLLCAMVRALCRVAGACNDDSWATDVHEEFRSWGSSDDMRSVFVDWLMESDADTCEFLNHLSTFWVSVRAKEDVSKVSRAVMTVFDAFAMFEELMRKTKYSTSLVMNYITSCQPPLLQFFIMFAKACSMGYCTSITNTSEKANVSSLLRSILEEIRAAHLDEELPFNPTPLIKCFKKIVAMYEK
eukprot:TRINITY_DN634_c0_g1_i4.p1 TRINITY_DN634_c0_g1~~TRINITY_DN634_c0_g1_i4.p1  ORF type:complete len:519 (+),score=132.19 TRINITY_DN634_c0_g1_i4:101-1558(+)